MLRRGSLRSYDFDLGHGEGGVQLEGELDTRLENTGTSDAVDVADATAQGPGDLAEVRSQGAIGKPEGRCVRQVEGVEACLKRRLAEDGKGLEE